MARPSSLERFGPDFSKSGSNVNQELSSFNEPLSDGTLLLVNLNTATERELRMIPGVGANLARKIINNRPYGSVWSLMKIEGVGKKRVESLAPHVTVE
ncbi:MAG: helix-hairpin-helix domain-containing protein [Cyanothece sp. SIO1E1]|nr:helix-hairpin-helix domain-containing protein [Cyanothece sp. SIO1E1]